MARPQKCRKICRMPKVTEYIPVSRGAGGTGSIIMTIDEYECIRLMDKEGFSQEKCGRYMEIARTTVQAIYKSARTKIAEALINGLPLLIQGGEYKICDGREPLCGCGGCGRHRREYNKPKAAQSKNTDLEQPDI